MNLRAALYFVAGVVVGSAATFFAVRGHFMRQCEEMAEEAWEDANDHYMRVMEAKEKAEKNRKEKQEREKQVIKESKSEEPAGETKENSGGGRSLDIKKLRKEAQQKVRSYRRNVFDNPPDRHDVEIIENGDSDEEDLGAPSEGIREEPYVISSDQFANENPYWDKIQIFLYTDGCAVDEYERIVDDLEACIGKENLDRIEELADEDGSVLIRNEMRSSDYEVLLMDETYIPDTAPVRDD